MDESALLLNEGQQLDAARQLEFQRIERAQKDAQNRVAKKNAARLLKNVTRVAQPELAVAEVAANLSYRKLWQYGQEAVELAAISFVDFMIFTGPLAIMMYFTRLVVGNWFKGGGTIRYQNFSMQAVPEYSMVEGLYRTVKILWIILFTFFVWSAIIVSGYIFTHPGDTAKLGIYAAWCWLTTFFGKTCG